MKRKGERDRGGRKELSALFRNRPSPSQNFLREIFYLSPWILARTRRATFYDGIKEDTKCLSERLCRRLTPFRYPKRSSGNNLFIILILTLLIIALIRFNLI